MSPLDGPEAVIRTVRILSAALARHGVRHLIKGSAALVLQGYPLPCADVDVELPCAAVDLGRALAALGDLGFALPPGPLDNLWHCGYQAGRRFCKVDLTWNQPSHTLLWRDWVASNYDHGMRHAIAWETAWLLPAREVLIAKWQRGRPQDFRVLTPLLTAVSNRPPTAHGRQPFGFGRLPTEH